MNKSILDDTESLFEKMKIIKEQLNIIDVAKNLYNQEPEKITSGKWKYLYKTFYKDEKTASLKISDSLQLYNCFSTNRCGDVIKLYREYKKHKEGRNISLEEACNELITEYDLDIKQISKSQYLQYDNGEKLLFEVFKQVCYYANLLLKSESIKSLEVLEKQPRKYLLDRAINNEVKNVFMIGYINDNYFQSLLQTTISIDMDVLKTVGLVNEYNKFNFSEHIIFPLKDEKGYIVSLVGRNCFTYAQKDERYKKLKSDELVLSLYPHIKANDYLYNLDIALPYAKATGYLILVEGYFDVFRLYQEGIYNVAAIQTTNLTSRQIEQLAKVNIKEIFLLLDGDKVDSEEEDNIYLKLCKIKSGNHFLFHKVFKVINREEYRSLRTDPDEYFLNKSFDEIFSFFKEKIDYRQYYIERQIDEYKENEGYSIYNLYEDIGLFINDFGNQYIDKIKKIIETNELLQSDCQIFKTLFNTNHEIQSLYLMNELLCEQEYCKNLLIKSELFIRKYLDYKYLMDLIYVKVCEFYDNDKIKIFNSVENRKLYGDKSHLIVLEAFNSFENKEFVCEIDYIEECIKYFIRYSSSLMQRKRDELNFFKSSRNILISELNEKCIQKIIQDIDKILKDIKG